MLEKGGSRLWSGTKEMAPRWGFEVCGIEEITS